MSKYSLKILLEDAATEFDAEAAVSFFGDTDERIKKSLSKSVYNFGDSPKSGNFEPQFPSGVAGQISSTAPPVDQVTGADFENMEQKTRIVGGKPVKDDRENIKKIKTVLNTLMDRDLSTKTLSIGSETFVVPHKGNLFGIIYGHMGRQNPIYRDLFRMGELYKDYVSMGAAAIGDFYEDLAAGVFGFGNTNIAKRDASGTKRSEFADVFGEDTFFSVKGSDSGSDGLAKSRVKIKSMFTFLAGRPGMTARLGVIEGGKGWGGRGGRRLPDDYFLFHIRKSAPADWTLNNIELSLDANTYYTCGISGKTPILVRKQGDSFVPVDGQKVKYLEKEKELMEKEGIVHCDTAKFGSEYGLRYHRDDGWHWGSFAGSKSWVSNVASATAFDTVYFILPNVRGKERSLRRAALESVPAEERQNYMADQWADREAPDWSEEAYFSEHDMQLKGYIDRSEIRFVDLTPEGRDKYKKDYESWENENENAYQAAKELSLDKGRLADKVKIVFRSFEKIDPIKAKTLQDLVDEIYSMVAESNHHDEDLLIESKVLQYLRQARFKHWSTGI